MASSEGDPGNVPTQDPSWQQRVEQSPFGRGVLSALIVVTLIAIIAINLPGSDLRSQLLRAGQPYLNALGLDQNWALFAPNPRQIVLDVTGRVSFEDGVTRTWRYPHDGALVGTYRDYRWRKWAENLIAPENGAALWRSAALWAAARSARPGHAVTQVALIERYRVIEPPGAAVSYGPDQTRVIYTLRFDPGSGAP
jgi:hypothetical protein